MLLTDINKKCLNCGKDFVLTVGERMFYQEKKDENGQSLVEPKRCKECRGKRKERINERQINSKVEEILRGEHVTL